ACANSSPSGSFMFARSSPTREMVAFRPRPDSSDTTIRSSASGNATVIWRMRLRARRATHVLAKTCPHTHTRNAQRSVIPSLCPMAVRAASTRRAGPKLTMVRTPRKSEAALVARKPAAESVWASVRSPVTKPWRPTAARTPRMADRSRCPRPCRATGSGLGMKRLSRASTGDSLAAARYPESTTMSVSTKASAVSRISMAASDLEVHDAPHEDVSHGHARADVDDHPLPEPLLEHGLHALGVHGGEDRGEDER